MATKRRPAWSSNQRRAIVTTRDERFAIDEGIIRTNVLGAMATVDAGVKLLRASGGGQIVGITSVAGYRGLPGHAAYSASKAALNVYLEAVRAEVERDGITVTTLAPGYIDTPVFPWRAVGLLMRSLPDFLWYRVMRTQVPRRPRAS